MEPGPEVGARRAVSGHSQPHPYLVTAPPHPDGSQPNCVESLTVLLLASSWTHSLWGLGWDEGCGTGGSGGRRAWDPHLMDWLHSGLKVTAPVILSGSLSHILLVLVTSCLAKPGAGKDSRLQVALESCILSCGRLTLPTTVPRLIK